LRIFAYKRAVHWVLIPALPRQLAVNDKAELHSRATVKSGVAQYLKLLIRSLLHDSTSSSISTINPPFESFLRTLNICALLRTTRHFRFSVIRLNYSSLEEVKGLKLCGLAGKMVGFTSQESSHGSQYDYTSLEISPAKTRKPCISS